MPLTTMLTLLKSGFVGSNSRLKIMAKGLILSEFYLFAPCCQEHFTTLFPQKALVLNWDS